MFDEFLRQRASATGDAVRPVRRRPGLRRLRRRQAARGRRALVPAVARHRAARGRRRTTRRTPTRSTARQPQERAGSSADPRATASQVYEGSVGYVDAVQRRRAALRRRLLQRPTRHDVLQAAGLAGPVRRRHRRARRRRASTCTGKPAPDTFLAGARRWASTARRRRCSRTRSPAWRPGTPGTSASSSGSTASARRAELREHGADVVVEDLARPARAAVIQQARLRGRAVGAARDRARPRPARPERVGLRAVQRPHRPARQPRRGRAARAARHLPQRRSTSSGRCPTPRPAYGYPEAGQTVVNVTNGKLIRLLVDDEPFDVRYGDAAPPRARASTCAPASCAATSTGTSPAGQAVRVTLDPARLAHPARDRGDPLRGRAGRRPARIVVQSELVANEELPAGATTRDPRAAAALDVAAGQPSSRTPCDTRAGAGCTSPAAAGCGWRSAMDHEIDGPTRSGHRIGVVEDLGRLTVAAIDLAPGQQLRLVKFLALRLVAARVAARAASTRSAALVARRGTPAGTGCCAEQRELPRRLLGARRRRGRRRRRAPAGGPLRAVPRPPGGGARRAPRDPGQGPDRHRLRRPRVLGHRDLRAAGAHLHRRRTPPRDALRWRHSTLRAGARARRTSSASRAPPSPGGRSTARSARATGRPAPAAFHINADIADAVVRYHRPHRRRGVRTRTSASTCWSRPRGCGARSAITTPHGRLPHRRRHRPGRVQRDRRQQRLHQPDGAAEPARRRGGRRAASRGRAARARRRRRGGRRLARRRPRRCSSPTTSASRCTRRPTASPTTSVGTSRTPGRRRLPAAAALPVLRALPQAGGQAGRPGAGAVPARDAFTAEQKRATSPTTSR